MDGCECLVKIQDDIASLMYTLAPQLTRNPEGIILYEAQANPSDHKVKNGNDMSSNNIGM